MKPMIKTNGKHIMTTPMCGNCGYELHYKHYTSNGVPCYNSTIIVENFCPKCGEKVEGYEEVNPNGYERVI